MTDWIRSGAQLYADPEYCITFDICSVCGGECVDNAFDLFPFTHDTDLHGSMCCNPAGTRRCPRSTAN